jgi:hypothetical protein
MSLITITGNVLNPLGGPLYAVITWSPSSPPFPYVGSAGVITTTQPVIGVSSATDGSFSFVLDPGTYTVLFQANAANVGQFTVVVPSSGGPYTFDQVVTNANPPVISPLSGTGSPQGVVTGTPGQYYVDTTAGSPGFWVKLSGTGTTGWQNLIQL